MFQDAIVDTPSGATLIHNAGLLQRGKCFQLLHTGSAGAPAPNPCADLYGWSVVSRGDHIPPYAHSYRRFG